MPKFDDLRIRQLDEALAPFQALGVRPVPDEGWLRTIRESLGVSLRQMAARLGVSKGAVRSAEANEARGTIQLDSLRVMADALDCDVVYALVPRRSLERVVKDQALRLAEGLVRLASESMELEEQGISVQEQRRQVKEMASEILRNRGRDFWDG